MLGKVDFFSFPLKDLFYKKLQNYITGRPFRNQRVLWFADDWINWSGKKLVTALRWDAEKDKFDII